MTPEGLRYTEDHEWVKIDGDIAIIGITDYAQKQLTDIVFVELPEKGKHVTKGTSAGALESVKSVSDILSPMTGEVLETNQDLADNPQLINEDPYGKGWLFKIKISDPAEAETLLDLVAYTDITKEA
ncbi:glycine cleavage system protein H [Candidatus Woesearchaeota archaeon CG11_big_fil_rev_8_21_14_0_20_43_8]|nr:MAG: glycine cleavage system protein H [Candidatus Woesearchaeota archaeon CG11_big_fil_rev_8_21_14_0_20_43_8]PIO05311.1 MAG: glycine cleavage system protein H [Candidatus Woesearchaeota archaeon CG08_land_8_20_14_0_20_43_7]